MKPKVQVVHDISQIPSRHKLCLYGSGQLGRIIFEILPLARPDITIEFWVDSFNEGKFLGLEVVLPNALIEHKKGNFDVVLVTSIYVEEIIHTFESLQVPVIYQLGKNLIDRTLLLNLHPINNQEYFKGIIIELTSIWNMAIELFGPSRLTFPCREMPFDLLKKIIKQIDTENLTRIVALHGSSTYPHLVEAIAYAKAQGLTVKYFTNGRFLEKKCYEQLLACKTNYITISVKQLGEITDKEKQVKAVRHILDLLDIHLASDHSSTMTLCIPYSRANTHQKTPPIFTTIDRESFKEFLIAVELIVKKKGRPYLLDNEDLLETLTRLNRIGKLPPEIIKLTDQVALGLVPVRPTFNATATKGNYSDKCWQQGCFPLCEDLKTPQILADGLFLPCSCLYPHADPLFEPIIVGKINEHQTISHIYSDKPCQNLLNCFRENGSLIAACRACLEQDDSCLISPDPGCVDLTSFQ